MTVEPQAVGEVAIFDTNRSITGQDGAAYASVEEALAGDDFGASLAARLFAADERVDHVWVQSNVATMRRREGWDDGSLAAAAKVIRDFFVFYQEPPAAAPAAEEADPAG